MPSRRVHPTAITFLKGLSTLSRARILERWEISGLIRKKYHRFFFNFFPTNEYHVNTINTLLLDNYFHSPNVVFESMTNFTETLEWYLTALLKVGKKMVGTDTNLRELTLKKIEAVSRSLGSSEEAVWVKLDNPLVTGYKLSRQLHIHMI
ncbi:hypothetical protein B0H67DRAFT_321698 [Lasiosphaeris hirsuta]|uniref:Uncharacterized protein n=1 Tax=Lasiosphaeris hirsuta TaxID=260670 RepID=A0AA40DL69_9PEZI|nr:hypothetical protein B0H67DRAFT_321698 [Lasiosphaeris hirsuta]